MSFEDGLSPLARGNRTLLLAVHSRWGPIPARTGQPPSRCRAESRKGAYPRSHGATKKDGGGWAMESGLSPLARGNPPRGIRPHYIEGPIPARTGQPSPVPWRSAFGGAYPRSHGATGVNISDELVDYGLSPLARGNRPG